MILYNFARIVLIWKRRTRWQITNFPVKVRVLSANTCRLVVTRTAEACALQWMRFVLFVIRGIILISWVYISVRRADRMTQSKKELQTWHRECTQRYIRSLLLSFSLILLLAALLLSDVRNCNDCLAMWRQEHNNALLSADDTLNHQPNSVQLTGLCHEFNYTCRTRALSTKADNKTAAYTTIAETMTQIGVSVSVHSPEEMRRERKTMSTGMWEKKKRERESTNRGEK